jgi:hypothetical protein
VVVYNKDHDIHDHRERPSGTSAAAALRRLEKDRPDIHARVLAGELSANAGMVEAGFRKPRQRHKITPLDKIRKLWLTLTDEEREIVRNWR